MMPIRPFHLLVMTFLAGAFVLCGVNRAWAVVPPSAPLGTTEKEQVQTKEEHLLGMIENIRERERQNMEMLNVLKSEFEKFQEEKKGCSP